MVTKEQVDKAVKKNIKPTNIDVSFETLDLGTAIRARINFLGDSNAKAGYSEVEFYEDRMVWMSLFLEPEYQQKGVITYLHDAGAKLARDLGYDKVLIPIDDTTSEIAKKNYADAGYKKIREGMLEVDIGPTTSGPEKYAKKKSK